jgi:hypothetical protein
LCFKQLGGRSFITINEAVAVVSVALAEQRRLDAAMVPTRAKVSHSQRPERGPFLAGRVTRTRSSGLSLEALQNCRTPVLNAQPANA